MRFDTALFLAQRRPPGIVVKSARGPVSCGVRLIDATSKRGRSDGNDCCAWGRIVSAPTTTGAIPSVTAARIRAARRARVSSDRLRFATISSMRVARCPPRTPETKKGRFVISVLRRPLDVVDDQHLQDRKSVV